MKKSKKLFLSTIVILSLAITSPIMFPNNNVRIEATKNTNSDLELITQSGHPTLFSSTNAAHEFWKDQKGFFGWKDREDKKIIYPDTFNNDDQSACILAMDSDMNFGNCYSDYIFGIHIIFDNFEKPAKLTLKQALKITYSYLPYNTLKSFYKFKQSASYKAIKKSKIKDCYYDISYFPKNKNKYNFVLDKHSYKFPNIHITLHKGKKGYITDIWIELYQSILSGRNGVYYDSDYKKIKWKYDFLKQKV